MGGISHLGRVGSRVQSSAIKCTQHVITLGESGRVWARRECGERSDFDDGDDWKVAGLRTPSLSDRFIRGGP